MARTVTLRLFARLREEIGTEQEHLTLPEHIQDVAALKQWLAGRGDGWLALTARADIHTAVNEVLVPADTPLGDGDEVAFFPPVTGG